MKKTYVQDAPGAWDYPEQPAWQKGDLVCLILSVLVLLGTFAVLRAIS